MFATESNIANPNMREHDMKPIRLCEHDSNDPRGIALQELRPKLCCALQKGSSETVSSLPACPVRRRFPLATLKKIGTLTSSSFRRKAILPNRRPAIFVDERPPKRFCPSLDPSEIVPRIGLQDRSEREKVSEKFLSGQRNIDLNSSRSTIAKESKDTKESEENNNSSNGIDSDKIFRQLNILKRGGYWKHLIGEDMSEEERHQDEDRPQYEQEQSIVPREENKENVSRASHPNTQIDYGSHGAWDYGEDEDAREEEESHRDSAGPFIGSALATNNQFRMVGSSFGFRVHSITEDGWMCCLEGFPTCLCTKNCIDGDEPCASPSGTPQKSMVMLHLPTKVAALGRKGMLVSGVDLMKRRDNGALEPHTHSLPSNPLTASTNHLFGRISLQ